MIGGKSCILPVIPAVSSSQLLKRLNSVASRFRHGAGAMNAASIRSTGICNAPYISFARPAFTSKLIPPKSPAGFAILRLSLSDPLALKRHLPMIRSKLIPPESSAGFAILRISLSDPLVLKKHLPMIRSSRTRGERGRAADARVLLCP